MRKSRFLCVWERGGGSAHLFQLSVLVEALHRAGHEVVLCTKDEAYVREFFRKDSVTIYGLPATLEPRPNALARSHAELLFNLGFGDSRAVSAYLGRWRELIDTLRPDAVFCDHSDGALLAAYGLSVPAVLIGTGFFQPPDQAPMPAYDIGLEVDQAAVARVENIVLASINSALKMHGNRHLGRLADIYAYAARLVTTFFELDCYGSRQDVDYLGALGPTGRLADPVWNHDGEKAYCYFTRGRLPDWEFVRQVTDGGYSLLIAAPGIADADRASLIQCGATVINRHVDLEQVCAQCRYLFSEGNHGTTAKILRYGRVPMLIPRQMEQLATANRLQRLSLGVYPDRQTAAPMYLNLINAIDSDPVYEINAQRFSNEFRDWDERVSASKVREAVSRMLNL